MLVIFEGLDGTGKTTLAKVVAREMSAEYIRTPPESFSQTRKMVHYNGRASTRFLFYLSSVLYVSDQIRSAGTGKFFVCDRYYYTSIADYCFHEPMTYEDMSHWVTFMENKCFVPNLVVYCYCERNERLRRIHDRGAVTVSDDISINFEIAMNKAFSFLLPKNTLHVDTTQTSAEELFVEVKQSFLVNRWL